jgi:phage terminase large subunit-like protein
MHEYALKVRDGVIDDPNFYVAIFAADPGDDWKDPETWRKANPNLGVSISEDYLARECRRAQELPGYENTFKRLHLNLWTEQETRWLALDSWDACDLPVATAAELRGRTCVVGLDLSQTTDITAVVLTFSRADGTIDVVPRFYIPKENAEKRARRDRVPYPAWIAQGWIKATEGNVIDYEIIKEDILALSKVHDVREVAYDPWNATQIALQLEADGVSVIPVRQGFASMTAPSKHLEGLVLSRKIRHGANPVLRWMISNTAIEIDAAGNIKPSKKKSTERIDGVVGLINALSRAIVPGPVGSIYQRRGLSSI